MRLSPKRKKRRFPGAGGSLMREFKRRRREQLRKNWRDVGVMALLFVGAVAATWYFDGFIELLMAGIAGAVLMLATVVWVTGGASVFAAVAVGGPKARG